MSRILHLSDIHFGPPHLHEVSNAVPALVGELAPDLIVVSGDLTQRAKPAQFQEARRFINSLGAPSVVVPGNHDVPLYRLWERLLTPYGAYSSHFSPELEPEYHDETMTVVGINSAHGLTFTEGRIRRSRLERLERQFEAVPNGHLKVAVIHHLLVAAPPFGRRKVLANAGETVASLARAGVELVLSGHYHQAFFRTSDELYRTGTLPILILATGTATSDRGRGAERGKNSCFLIEADQRSIGVTHLRWKPDRGSFRPHSEHRFRRG